jgi:hypothetical protein
VYFKALGPPLRAQAILNPHGEKALCAVSNQEAKMPHILRDAAKGPLLRMRFSSWEKLPHTTTLSRFAARVMPV